MHISISAIIPIYNVSNYIERCTRTLMEQSFQNVEFIFVNDCTPDNSIEILRNTLRDYPHRHPFVKIINNPKNLGLAATRFVGMSEAKGDYVWHCDSDDWVEKDMLQKMYDKAIIEDADIVCCEATKEYTGHSILCKYDYDKETLENGLLALAISEVHIAIWNKLVKRELYINNNISNYSGINMGEDSALTIRLRYFSKKTVILHEPLYHYNRMNANSMVRQVSENLCRERIELAKRLESFFKDANKENQFRALINLYKFDAKQIYLREFKDIKRWKEIFPECHKDIFKFKNLTLIGRVKWWICAYIPYVHLFIKKKNHQK